MIVFIVIFVNKVFSTLKTSTICDISSGNFDCGSTVCSCGTQQLAVGAPEYTLTGTTDQNHVDIDNLTPPPESDEGDGPVSPRTRINFQNFKIATKPFSTRSYFIIKNSSIDIQFEGTNLIDLNQASDKPGIECTDGSSISFSSTPTVVEDVNTLTVIGSGKCPGVGLGKSGGYCKALKFYNGTYTIKGLTKGSAIGGSDGVNEIYKNKIDLIEIDNGVYILSGGSLNGAAIGSYDRATFGEILIRNGTFILSTSSGPCIGGGKYFSKVAISGGDFDMKPKGGPAIGVGQLGSAGTIEISGGTFRITTNGNCAIGSGIGSLKSIDSIVISGGNITVTISEDSFSNLCAAIGGGSAGDSGVRLIDISGGVLKLESRSGAAIGCGQSSSVDEIRISGGQIYAECLNSGAGIGCGSGGSVAGSSYVGLINISGGEIVAIGKQGAGIGAGTVLSRKNFDNISSVGKIVISGNDTIIRAIGNDAAGIGGGAASSKNTAKVTEIVITGGEIESNGYVGIGASHCINCEKVTDHGGQVSTISISGGNITAVGEVVGIGVGEFSDLMELDISGGKIHSSGKFGGIGGYGGYLENISITGKSIVGAFANVSGCGIGCGYNGPSFDMNYTCKSIKITSGEVTAIGEEEGAGIGGGFSFGHVGEISIEGEPTVIAIGGLDGAGIGGGKLSNVEKVLLIKTNPKDRIKIDAIGGANSQSGIGNGTNGILLSLIAEGAKIICEGKSCAFPGSDSPFADETTTEIGDEGNITTGKEEEEEIKTTSTTSENGGKGNSESSKGKDKLGSGEITGIVIACIAVVAALIGITVFLLFRKKQKNYSEVNGDQKSEISDVEM